MQPDLATPTVLAWFDYGRAATDIRHLIAINGAYELPFGVGHAFLARPRLDRVAGGWTLATIANLQTGFSFSPQLGYNPTGSGDTRNPVRPDVNPRFRGALYTSGSTRARVARFFNPAAFQAPTYGTVGNAGRDTLTGPNFYEWTCPCSRTSRSPSARTSNSGANSSTS